MAYSLRTDFGVNDEQHVRAHNDVNAAVNELSVRVDELGAAERERVGLMWGGVDFPLPVLDGTVDCGPYLNDAINALHERGGGTIVLPSGTYGIATPIGNAEVAREFIAIQGMGPRGVKWHFGNGALDPDGKPWLGGAYLKVIDDSEPTDIITGIWHNCTFKDLAFDVNGRGGVAVRADLSWTVFDRCEFSGYTTYAMWLGQGLFQEGNGFLNKIMYCNFSDTGYEGGAAIRAEEKFIDSWIMYNNIEAGPDHADLEIYSGGPIRVIGNHMNGSRSPKNNILIDSGVRECLISENILEGARQSAVVITGPGWKTEPERQSISINGNIIRQFAQDGEYPAILADMATTNEGFVAEGLVVSGNVISTDYTPTYVLDLKNWKDVSAVGNYWRTAHTAEDAVRAVDCDGVEVVGNHADNDVRLA